MVVYSGLDRCIQALQDHLRTESLLKTLLESFAYSKIILNASLDNLAMLKTLLMGFLIALFERFDNQTQIPLLVHSWGLVLNPLADSVILMTVPKGYLDPGPSLAPQPVLPVHSYTEALLDCTAIQKTPTKGPLDSGGSDVPKAFLAVRRHTLALPAVHR
jgi:hypothetical protein